MNNIVNQVPYLQTSRNFPDNQKELGVELNKSYIDIANAVNQRIIGIFTINRPSITGEGWFILANKKQQSFRQVYTFTSTASIDLGFKFTSINSFTKSYGSFTDGTNWYGLIYGTSVAIAGQLEYYFKLNPASTTSDQIVFVSGAGVPVLTSGLIVVEWISQV